MKHLDEETIELYVLNSEEVRDRRAKIDAHLKKCAGCMLLASEIQEYYSDVQVVQEERSKAISQALTMRTMAVKVPSYTEFGPLSQIRKSWPARVVLFVIRHPYVATSSFVGLIVGAVLAAQLLVLPALKDRNPSYARAKEEFLVVYNKEGDVLWKKHVGIGYDMDVIAQSPGIELDVDKYLTVADVDRDGKSEVLAIYRQPDPPVRELLCFNTDGTERWRYGFQRSMVFGAEEFSGQFEFLMMMVGDFDRNGIIEVVSVATFPHYYPTAILKIDASTGNLLREFWSSGNVNQIAHHDFDGDGREELYFGGSNNGTDRAFLIVIDPQMMSGCTPAPASYSPLGVTEGTEKYYLEFPRSELQKVAIQKRNTTKVVRFPGDSSLTVAVGELVGRTYYLEFYHFNQKMACTKADWQDETMSLYKKLNAEGKLTQTYDSAYYERLRDGVQYWDGDKFVNTPTMNRRYVESMGRPAMK